MSYAEKAKSSKKQKETNKNGSSSNQTSPSNKQSSFSNVVATVKSLPFLKHRGKTPQNHYEPLGRDSFKLLSDIKEESNDNDKCKRLKDELERYLEEKCESPFNWKPKEAVYYANVSISRLLNKNLEIKDDRQFKWRNFILQLVMSYENYVKKDLDEALNWITNIEGSMIKLSKCHEWLFLGIEGALWHVILASKVFLLLQMNKIKEADVLAKNICPAHIVGRKQSWRAGLHGIKAAVFMEYGHDGNVIALEEAKLAVNIDKTCAEWFFLKGKCMGRIRRFAYCHEDVTKEEVGAFNMAVKRDEAGKHEKKNPEYLVHLAQVLREQSKREYKDEDRHHVPNMEEFKKMMKKQGAAYYKYRAALELRPDCPHILTRVAYGLMKMPYNFVDLKLIRETIEKAIKLAPKNPMAHHVMGLYHERFGTEADLALDSLAEAVELGNFGAHMDLIKMQYRLSNQFNVIEALEEALDIYKDPHNQEVMYAQCGSFYLFIKKDLLESLKYYTKAGGKNMDSYAMKSHKPMFIRMKNPVNMFEVLLEEMSTNTNWDDFDKEDRKILTRFRFSLVRIDHETQGKKDRLSVLKILQMSRERMDYDHCYKAMREAREAKKRKRPFKWIPKKKKKDPIQENQSCSPKESHIHSQNSALHTGSQREGSNTNACSKPDILVNPFQREGQDTSMSNKFSMERDRYSKEGRILSRCSSVASICSSEDDEVRPVGRENVIHTSRFSQSKSPAVDPTVPPTKDLKNLSIHGSEDDISRDINIGTRKMSLMSISSDECIGLSQSSENVSVQDRVKQIYRNSLSYKNVSSKGVSNIHRSDSTQSLNKGQTKQNRGKRSNLQRSDSTQSLNPQPSNSMTTKYLEGGYKSAFGSKDPIEEITRSMSFLPSFCRKNSESDAN